SIPNDLNIISQVPTLDIIDEYSNTSKSIWEYFTKIKKNNKMIAKCKHFKNSKYSITNGTTINLWGHLKNA
ncbi:12361_t:CDS:1, partial [Racocetra persica]